MSLRQPWPDRLRHIALDEDDREEPRLDLPAQIYATMGFAALSEQNSGGGLRCEFLGHRTVGRDGNSEAIFRVVRSHHV